MTEAALRSAVSKVAVQRSTSAPETAKPRFHDKSLTLQLIGGYEEGRLMSGEALLENPSPQ